MNDRYEYAREAYRKFGVDTDKALQVLKTIPISMHCWQADDLTGFEEHGGTSGGISATGNYPGRPRNVQEMMQDLSLALSLIPGKHRLNMHAVYAVGEPGEVVERHKVEPRHFAPWVEFARENGLLGLDMNSTPFSHPMAADNLTLSSPNPAVREYWIEHSKACRKIADYFGKELGSTSLHDIWIPDGYKDIPADRLGPRQRLKESLDEILKEPYEHMLDCVEAKLFGIGVESYTVGSHEFYMNYVAHNPNVIYLMDSGHFHPTETIADKIPSLLLFEDKVALHVTRNVRWDSDHVVLFDQETQEIAKEIIRCQALDKVVIGLDFFDASINRVSALVVGMRNMIKALLYALLMPHDRLKALQEEGNFTEQMMLQEELKTLPFGDVWNVYCQQQNVPQGADWYPVVKAYADREFPKR